MNKKEVGKRGEGHLIRQNVSGDGQTDHGDGWPSPYSGKKKMGRKARKDIRVEKFDNEKRTELIDRLTEEREREREWRKFGLVCPISNSPNLSILALIGKVAQLHVRANCICKAFIY